MASKRNIFGVVILIVFLLLFFLISYGASVTKKNAIEKYERIAALKGNLGITTEEFGYQFNKRVNERSFGVDYEDFIFEKYFIKDVGSGLVEHRFDVADKVLMISATVDKATGKIKTITVMGAPLNLNEQACLAMMYEVTICILNDGFTPKDANYIMRKS